MTVIVKQKLRPFVSLERSPFAERSAGKAGRSIVAAPYINCCHFKKPHSSDETFHSQG
ncbi:hypothetical protein [Anabaena azotica]|uniref:Uncharacterized protein n=1 Tax=Anabaena azotica FACHB-119 TaxID=947527 RepID=A0ABR8DEW2_9NOST|nr:hypothetical protein [Anabaena azotica]MBD2505181.1 hypothetical protein [Anabaena azotica FACHB-119]